MAGHPRYKSLDEALWSRVDKRGPDDCWLWTKGVGSHGYGEFHFRGQVLTAHVIAYRLSTGSLGVGHILHRCDVKRCCNPKHLYLGDQTLNNRDARARNQIVNIPRGEDAPKAKLTAADVQAIRAEHTNVRYGAKHHLVLAKRYGVHPDTISSIWSGRTWRDN